MSLYPVFLDLRDARVVIVGGGPVAASKLDGLLAAGARVTVIAPEICEAIRSRGVHLIEREFTATDLDAREVDGDIATVNRDLHGSTIYDDARTDRERPATDDGLDRTTDSRIGTSDRDNAIRIDATALGSRPRWVVAAATPDVNREVAAAAAARGLFVNAVDDKKSATAYLGGVIRRGEVTVAISTGGIAPALAGLLREALDAVLPEDLERWLEVARDARSSWKRNAVPMTERRPLLLRALDRIYGGAS